MQGREDLDRLLALGADLAGRRLELARTREDLFPVLTLRLMQRSGQPLDRAAAWLVAAQRRPAVFLRLADRALDDGEAVVRTVVMEGIGLAALVLERPPGDPTIAALLERGSSDSSAHVRKAAHESLVLFERFADAEELAAMPLAEALTIALLERLLPESPRPRRRRTGPELRRKATQGARPFGRESGTGPLDPARTALLEELAPLARFVARAAVDQGLSSRDVETLIRAGREKPALASAVGELDSRLPLRGHAGPSAWEALARAIRDTVPGDGTFRPR